MDPDKVLDLYDEAFATDYDDRFLLTWWGRDAATFELAVIRDALGEQGTFLDVGCGTGWVLSHFQGHRRAGLDLSPAMLARARSRPQNRDVEFRQGDFRDSQAGWDRKWDLVSCMWFAYCYVDTVPQVAGVIENLATWTAPTGAVFLPICDPEGIGLAPITYRKPPGDFSAEMRITSFTWSWDDPMTGKWHEHLVALHAEYLTELFARHFREIRVLEYPVVDFDGYLYRRKALLALRKRHSGDEAPAEVIRRPPPNAEKNGNDDSAVPPAAIAAADEPPARTFRALVRRGLLRGVYALARRLET